MEVTRNLPADRPQVQRYRGGGFTVSGVRYEGPVLVLPTRTMTWPVAAMTSIDLAALIPILQEAGVGLCLFGCGARMEPVPAPLRQALRDAGIGVDSMETGAASRSFGVLTGEGRAVAAVLIPLS